MSIVKLPIAESPVIGYQRLAYELGILLGYEECLPWFYCNFIQLKWKKELKSPINFFCPWFTANPVLGTQVFKISKLRIHHIDIHSFIMECIDSKEYFYSTFDEFYVPHRVNFGKLHFVHDFMIYGYDSGQKEYLLLGFDERQTYKTTSIRYDEFEKAYFSDGNRLEYVHLINKNENARFEFDIHLVYEMLDDYINSRNTSERHRMYNNPMENFVFGMEIYEYLRIYFTLLGEERFENDIKLLHIFYEHKKCMALRIEYMLKNHYIDPHPSLYEDYGRIVTDVLALRNIQLKYNITNDRNYLEQIVNMLSHVENKEKTLLRILSDMIYKRIMNTGQ